VTPVGPTNTRAVRRKGTTVPAPARRARDALTAHLRSVRRAANLTGSANQAARCSPKTKSAPGPG
jgi:hypothetical protein